ncbi:LysR family transcriptional regulator [uncultured Azohydromonas sp.]|jgi:Transcriptional regulator|uniref:LysR family transcriptional regulator n=1 Tax=uncultured Azohydromonas sp. TaxID=487342 RepID=UPI00262106AB|nr:LysR family transcriptional regulator [uncultured Azohydromonas sp.]
MRRTLPSTAALAAFESAARHQSFTKAADELSVTQSAVCRQIASLEDFLGVKLFRRDRRGVALTDAGATYSRQVAARLDEVERDTLDLMAKGSQGGTLELGVVPTFATKWLLPRLPRFSAQHPGITVNLNARSRPFLFDETPFDAAISAGERTWPGTEAEFLMHEELFPLASPSYLAAHRCPRIDEADWARCTLLQQSTRPYAWRQWFASRGVQVDGDMTGPRLELFSMLVEAAIHGLGVALVPRTLVEDELRRGVLVRASPHQHPGDRSYHLMWPERMAGNRSLMLFRDWLRDEARAYREAQGLG